MDYYANVGWVDIWHLGSDLVTLYSDTPILPS